MLEAYKKGNLNVVNNYKINFFNTVSYPTSTVHYAQSVAEARKLLDEQKTKDSSPASTTSPTGSPEGEIRVVSRESGDPVGNVTVPGQ